VPPDLSSGNQKRQVMTNNETKHRTITLTGRAPVRIVEDQWPVIAKGDYTDHDNQYESQANRTWKIAIRARRHQNGRTIVYGTYHYDTCFQNEKGETHKVGVLRTPDSDVAAAIELIAALLIERVNNDEQHQHISGAADDCIADLPAEDI
jgi:hypothetical protein